MPILAACILRFGSIGLSVFGTVFDRYAHILRILEFSVVMICGCRQRDDALASICGRFDLAVVAPPSSTKKRGSLVGHHLVVVFV